MINFKLPQEGTSSRNEVSILANREFLEGLIQLCPDSIIEIDRSGTVIISNQAAEKLTGLKHEDVVGKLSITQVHQPTELARDIKKKLMTKFKMERAAWKA